MNTIRIKRAERSDAEKLHEDLTQLSRELGDTHAAGLDDLVRHGFSETPAFAVYHDNQKTRRFYERLGFQAREDETVFDLQKPALNNLRRCP